MHITAARCVFRSSHLVAASPSQKIFFKHVGYLQPTLSTNDTQGRYLNKQLYMKLASFYNIFTASNILWRLDHVAHDSSFRISSSTFFLNFLPCKHINSACFWFVLVQEHNWLSLSICGVIYCQSSSDQSEYSASLCNI